MKISIQVLLSLFISGCMSAHASDSRDLPNFSDYAVEVYSGKLKIPDYYKESRGEWRDDMGKLVTPPIVNFAGKYYIGTHSCGADCRYYTLSNLSKGFDLNTLDIFSKNNGTLRRTFDRRTYVITLLSRPDSAMLIAQYHSYVNGTAQWECQERFFAISNDGKKIRPISKIIDACEDHH